MPAQLLDEKVQRGKYYFSLKIFFFFKDFFKIFKFFIFRFSGG